MVVFPAPVSPVIRNSPSVPSVVKSMRCVSLYGPKAVISR